jgi:DnaJ-domain-containing protein 1
VSIGRRFVDLVRANLNSLLDRTAESERRQGPIEIEALSDAELQSELERRQNRREGARRAAARNVEQEAWAEAEQAVHGGSGRSHGASGRGPRESRRYAAYGRRPTSGSGQDPALAKLYAQLECPYGADLVTVRKHYRQLMRKYHPDLHGANPEKQRLATELSQKLTTAYNELRRAIG